MIYEYDCSGCGKRIKTLANPIVIRDRHTTSFRMFCSEECCQRFHRVARRYQELTERGEK